MTETSQRIVHWQRTKRLMIGTLILWAIFSFGVHWFAASLNAISFLGFPLGYYMAVQGSEIIFVVMLFVFAAAQHKIDRETGFAEED